MVEEGLYDTSDSEHTRDKGELRPEARLLRKCGMVGPSEDQDDMDEMDDDRDLDVDTVVLVKSGDIEVGEDVKGVVVLTAGS